MLPIPLFLQTAFDGNYHMQALLTKMCVHACACVLYVCVCVCVHVHTLGRIYLKCYFKKYNYFLLHFHMHQVNFLHYLFTCWHNCSTVHEMQLDS